MAASSAEGRGGLGTAAAQEDIGGSTDNERCEHANDETGDLAARGVNLSIIARAKHDLDGGPAGIRRQVVGASFQVKPWIAMVPI